MSSNEIKKNNYKKKVGVIINKKKGFLGNFLTSRKCSSIKQII
jgi:hypothetical protein